MAGLPTHVFNIAQDLVRESLSFSLTVPNTGLLGVTACVVIAWTLITRDSSLLKRRFFWGAMVMVCLASAHVSIMPQDDLYSNLLSAFNWASGHGLSVNRSRHQEGTVEYFYYLTIRALAGPNRAGILYLSVLLSGVCGFLSLVVFHRILLVLNVEWKLAAAYTAFPLLISRYLLVNLWSGYGNNLFFLVLEVSFLLFLLGPIKRKQSFFIMALLPLLRPEGVIVLPIVILFSILADRKWRPELRSISIFIVTTLGAFLGRKLYFGHWAPVPALSKESPFLHFPSIFYGFKRLMETGAPFFMFLGAVVAMRLVLRRHLSLRQWKTDLGILSLTVLAMTILYKLNGGDFLFMNRYDLPLVMGTIALAAIGWDQLWQRKQVNPALLLVMMSLGLLLPNQYSPVRTFLQEFWNDRRTPILTRTYFDQMGAPYKEGLARFFNRMYSNVPKSFAVTELNAFAFFSDHRIDDMLGTTNADIAFTKPAPDVARWPGYKKRNPKLLEVYRSDWIVGRHLGVYNALPEFCTDSADSRPLTHECFQWGTDGGGYELGGERYLEQLGYLPVILKFKSMGFSMRIRENESLNALKEFRALLNQYHVPFTEIVKTYIPTTWDVSWSQTR